MASSRLAGEADEEAQWLRYNYRTSPVPRASTSFITVRRSEGDLENYKQARTRECHDAFISQKHLDLHPFLCASQECRVAYNQLAAPSYMEEKVHVQTDVMFDGGSFFDFPSRNNRPEIISELARYPIRQELHFQNARRLESLFQAWLFFGFLHEILGGIDYRELFREDEHGAIVLTIQSFVDTLLPA